MNQSRIQVSFQIKHQLYYVDGSRRHELVKSDGIILRVEFEKQDATTTCREGRYVQFHM